MKAEHQTPALSMPDDGSRIVCACAEATEAQIKAYFAAGQQTPEDLIRDTGIGNRCTACLVDIDLILNQTFNLRVDRSTLVKATHGTAPTRLSKGLPVLSDDRESGFFIQNDRISTFLSFVNYGELFKNTSTVVPFSYRLRLYGRDGRKAVDQSGRIEPQDAVVLPFARLPNCPEDGWFLLSLGARASGLFGAMRPQFMLVGKGFSASVHTQPHVTACTGKSVMLLPDERGYHATVSVLNPNRGPASVTLARTDLAGSRQGEWHTVVPGLGSRLIALDDVLSPAPANEPCIVRVVSDKRVRKHIINELVDGRLSIDHFPNRK